MNTTKFKVTSVILQMGDFIICLLAERADLALKPVCMTVEYVSDHCLSSAFESVEP